MIKKIIAGLVFLFSVIAGVYFFMTSSRPFDLGIEINQKMNEIAQKNGLTVRSENISVKEIKRPIIKKIRIEAHKLLNKFDLMTYGHEQAERFVFMNSKGDTLIICNTLLLGDHLRILEIQLASDKPAYAKDFEQLFIKDHIIWTKNDYNRMSIE